MIEKIISGFIIIIFLLLNNFANAEENRKIFIMLNVDNTILDRVTPDNEGFLNKLSAQGFYIQKMEFVASASTSPKFIKIYEKISKKEYVEDEANYMSQIIAKKKDEFNYHITEYIVMRPSIKYLIEQLKTFSSQVEILLTSRNDDARTKNLHDHLNFKIAGEEFKQYSTFIPRDWFRIKTKTKNFKEISFKSAQQLRKKYSVIRPNDIVILLDHIETSRFIKSKNSQDFNIVVSKFNVENGYNKQNDFLEMDKILQLIKNKINN